MLQNNNEVLLNMFSQEMTFLLDAKERQEELELQKLDQLIRQQQSFRKASADAGTSKKTKTNLPVCLGSQTLCTHLTRPD